MLNGEREIKILGEMVPINAEIVSLDNVSAHADAIEILSWLKQFKREPQKIFITHGETVAANALKNRIEKELGWRNCVVPSYLQKEAL